MREIEYGDGEKIVVYDNCQVSYYSNVYDEVAEGYPVYTMTFSEYVCSKLKTSRKDDEFLNVIVNNLVQNPEEIEWE